MPWYQQRPASVLRGLVVISVVVCFVGCTVSSTKLTVVNLPECVGLIEANFRQQRGEMVVEARLHASVKNRRAVFENLGKKLEEYNFDLAEDIQVEVILRAKQLACGDLGVRRGTIKVSKDGDSEIDYESLGY